MKTNLLNKRDTALFHDILEKESSELRGALRNRASATIESVAEECARTVLAGHRELTVVLFDRASKQLRDREAGSSISGRAYEFTGSEPSDYGGFESTMAPAGAGETR
jgi:hypothetical protein